MFLRGYICCDGGRPLQPGGVIGLCCDGGRPLQPGGVIGIGQGLGSPRSRAASTWKRCNSATWKGDNPMLALPFWCDQLVA